MSENVVNLDEHRPHTTGTAICLACRHEWEAVAPIGVEWLQCPQCLLTRGLFKMPFEISGRPRWACGACENDLLFVYEDGLFCPNCGHDVEYPPPGGNDVPDGAA